MTRRARQPTTLCPSLPFDIHPLPFLQTQEEIGWIY